MFVTLVCKGQSDSAYLTYKVEKVYWEPQKCVTDIDLFSVYFSDENVGYVVGVNRKTLKSVLFKTTDGCDNWNIIDSNLKGYTDTTNYNTHLGIIFSDNGAMYIDIIDFGYNNYVFESSSVHSIKNYEIQYTHMNMDGIRYTDNIRYAIRSNKILFAFGYNEWSVLYDDTNKYLNSVDFINENIGYAVGNNGLILKTTDGGKNWENQPSGTDCNLNAVYFINKNIGYAVGYNGTILKTVNGGDGFKTPRD